MLRIDKTLLSIRKKAAHDKYTKQYQNDFLFSIIQ